jgi:hypothetical protein
VRKSVGNTLKAIGIDNEFLSKTQKAQQLRNKIDKCDYMNLKSCKTEETASKLKGLPTEGEKNFAFYLSDKGIMTKIFRGLKKLNSQKNQ